METVIKEIEPIVLSKHEFGNRRRSKNVQILAVQFFQASGSKNVSTANVFEYHLSRRTLSIDTLSEEMQQVCLKEKKIKISITKIKIVISSRVVSRTGGGGGGRPYVLR